MSYNQTDAYDVDPHVAEVYDQIEAHTEDVALLRRLLSGAGPLRILEPFCGTGRILIPLAQDGHTLVGIDQAAGMLERARQKVAALPAEVQERLRLIRADVTAGPWPDGFNVVILGGNCFYELATAEEQEGCIASAARALRPGGHLYLDNNHMEGELDESWRRPGVRHGVFPTGTCEDGTRVEGTSETIWFDAPGRLWRARRTATLTYPDGTTLTKEWVQQKHPVSVGEQREWLARHGFVVERLFGGRDGSPYTAESERAIFWAQRAAAPRPPTGS
ncbi:MAG: class I SAM-dependent methyltransferase [Armatimonadetes bacterium]|jgi:SAM-dependent methyltransferase|nr:class I SAM-dependent methyltransferase [Armatimonadota bacterium]